MRSKLLLTPTLFFILIFCRHAYSSYNEKIIGGEIVTQDDRLSLSVVALTNGTRSGCTGTLITRKHIITAAHCLMNPKVNQIGLGTEVGENMTLFKIARKIPHPQYDRRSRPQIGSPRFDIGIIELEDEVPSNYLPIKLLEPEVLLQKGHPLLLAGFGITGDGRHDGGTLRKVWTIFDKIAYGQNEFYFGPTPGKSSCKGDSGGPAFIKTNNQELYIVGVTSRGTGGGCNGYGIYTHVPSYFAWIQQIIQSRS